MIMLLNTSQDWIKMTSWSKWQILMSGFWTFLSTTSDMCRVLRIWAVVTRYI